MRADVSRPVGRSVRQSVGRSARQSFGRSVVRSFGRSANRLVGRSVGQSVGRTVGQSVGRSVGQWVNRSVGRSLARSLGRFSRLEGGPYFLAPCELENSRNTGYRAVSRKSHSRMFGTVVNLCALLQSLVVGSISPSLVFCVWTVIKFAFRGGSVRCCGGFETGTTVPF